MKEARRTLEEVDARSSSDITRRDFLALSLSKGCAIIGSEELPVVSRRETWLLPGPLRYPLVAFLNCLSVTLAMLSALGFLSRRRYSAYVSHAVKYFLIPSLTTQALQKA